MNPLLWFITLARTSGFALGMAGQSKLGSLFESLANVAESGADVEAHMAAVRARLIEIHAEGGSLDDADWSSVIASIESGSKRLQDS